MKTNYHVPVLLKEVINGLKIKSDGIYVDLTLGRAGHSSKILKRLNKDGLLIGVDQDDEAIEASKKRLDEISKNYKIVKDNFVNIKDILSNLKINSIDGALYDLGVSSPQFDEDYRGFSYRLDAPLDMRMDRDKSLTAKYIVNNYSLEKLNKIFKEYGEDRYSYNVAKNIIKERTIKPIETTLELVDIIKKSKPKKELEVIGHPAKQIFQALRIEVNDELNVLEKSLEDAINLLNVGGRLCVITFQSLEDKIVKKIFRKYSVKEGNRVNDYKMPDENDLPKYKEINKKVIIASEDEIKLNHRSKSAKLRILEKVR